MRKKKKNLYYSRGLSTHGFKKIIDEVTEDFHGFAQRDAHELLRFLIWQMNEELQKGCIGSLKVENPEVVSFETDARRYIH